MKKDIIYKTKTSWLFHILLLIILLPISIIIDYKEDKVLFSDIIYYAMPLIPFLVYTFFSLFSYKMIVVYKSGLEIRSFFRGSIKLLVWDEIEKIVMIFSRFTIMHLYYIRNEQVIRKNIFFTLISKKDLISIAYLLYTFEINIECKGAISENWKKNAIKKSGRRIRGAE